MNSLNQNNLGRYNFLVLNLCEKICAPTFHSQHSQQFMPAISLHLKLNCSSVLFFCKSFNLHIDFASAMYLSFCCISNHSVVSISFSSLLILNWYSLRQTLTISVCMLQCMPFADGHNYLYKWSALLEIDLIPWDQVLFFNSLNNQYRIKTVLRI